MGESFITGIPASNGMAIGIAHFIHEELNEEIKSITLSEKEVESELNLLEKLLRRTSKEIEILIEKTKNRLGEENAAIFVVQQEMLKDPVLLSEIENKIKMEKKALPTAIKEVIHSFVYQFLQLEDEYFSQRALDIKDFGKRLLALLQHEHSFQDDTSNEAIILVANDILPSEIINYSNHLAGIITSDGGKTSHTAFLAQSLGIPAVVGIGKQMHLIQHGDILIIDGYSGITIINPNQETIEDYKLKLETFNEKIKELEYYKNKVAITNDGYKINYKANISNTEEALIAYENMTEGIGLLRTEFLFIDHEQMPSEEEQFLAYKKIAEAMMNKPVVIRTLDIGGDKKVAYLDIPKENNPFLGLRGIRLSLKEKKLFMTQLRALLRASIYGNIKIMLPMITSLQEVREATELFHEAMEQLKNEGIAFDHHIEIGAMIETPAAVMIADKLAKEVDFFSLGTNDLIQYTLAVDRTNSAISELYDCFHPSVIAMIRHVVQTGKKDGIKVSLCGAMASKPLAIPLLLGLNLDDISVEISMLSEIKRIISKVNRLDCQTLADHILTLSTNEEVKETLEQFSRSIIR